jgi:hypothetical protein
MHTVKGRQLLWQKPIGFAADHCLKCELGWTRASAQGELTFCLLDREPVLTDMTSCDRYEAKEQP